MRENDIKPPAVEPDDSFLHVTRTTAKFSAKVGEKAALYIRYSTPGQVGSEVRQGASGNERARKLNVPIVEVYSDLGITGVTMGGREALHRVISDAKAKKFSILIVDGVSRLGRDAADILYLYKILNAYGIKIYESSGENELDLLQVAVKGIHSQLEHESLKRLAREGRAIAVAQGRVPFRNKFGFKVKGDGFAGNGKHRGSREPHPERAKIVQEFYELAKSGSSPADIANYAIKNGYPTPSACSDSDRGRAPRQKPSLWTAQCVYRIIKCPLYFGYIVIQRTKTIRDPITYKVIGYEKRDPAEFVKNHNPDLQIVSYETWIAANRMLKSRTTLGPSGDSAARHLFTGRVRCFKCGKPLQSAAQNGYRNYKCSTKEDDKHCSPINIRVHWLEKGILNEIERQLKVPDAIERFRSKFFEKRSQRERQITAARHQLQDKLNELDRRILASFDEAYNRGLADASIVRNRLALEDERQDVETKLDALPHLPPLVAPVNPLDIANAIAMIIGETPIRGKDEKTRRLVKDVRALIEWIQVWPVNADGKIKLAIHFNFGPLFGSSSPSEDGLLAATTIDRNAELAIDLQAKHAAKCAEQSELVAANQVCFTDDDWRQIEIIGAPINAEVEKLGWKLRNLIDVVCFQMTRRLTWRKIGSEFGPTDTARQAGQHLRSSDCWPEIVDAIQQLRPDMLAGATSLPKRGGDPAKGNTGRYASDTQKAESKQLELLAGFQDDPLSELKLMAVSMHLAGKPVAEIAKKLDIWPNYASSMYWKYQRRGMASFGAIRYAKKDESVLTPAYLWRQAELADVPDLHIVFRTLAHIAEGNSLLAAAKKSGLTRKLVYSLANRVQKIGVEGLKKGPWPLRKTAITPADKYRTLASSLRQHADATEDAEARRKLLALSMFMEGRTSTDIQRLLELSTPQLRQALDCYQERGVQGLLILPQIPFAPTEVDLINAEKIENAIKFVTDETALRKADAAILALRGGSDTELLQKTGVPRALAQSYAKNALADGVMALAKKTSKASLTVEQIEQLRPYIDAGVDPDDTSTTVTIHTIEKLCKRLFTVVIEPDTLRCCLRKAGIALSRDVKIRNRRKSQHFDEILTPPVARRAPDTLLNREAS